MHAHAHTNMMLIYLQFPQFNKNSHMDDWSSQMRQQTKSHFLMQYQATNNSK